LVGAFSILLYDVSSRCDVFASCGSTHNLQPANSYNCTQLSPKTASVVPPEDGCLTPKTCRGLRHNKVFVKVKVY
jgi:hypothetical protein